MGPVRQPNPENCTGTDAEVLVREEYWQRVVSSGHMPQVSSGQMPRGSRVWEGVSLLVLICRPRRD